jgi:mono/diheme cytochrome c family protein
MTIRNSAIFSILLSATLAFAVSSHWQHVPLKDHARSNPMASNPEAVASGSLVYQDHCQQCHQVNAEGDGHKRPSLRSERIRAATDGDLEWFLRQGDLRHGMPTWSSLPVEQRWQVIAWLRSIQ